MIDWNDMRVCLAVQRAGSWAQAAALLELNATTVSRRLVALEERLGARLFDRTPDGCVPTEAGLRLLARAERMEQEMLGVTRDLAGDDQRLDGRVRITATEMMATRFVAPHIHRLRARYPLLEVELSCTRERLDLGRREADVSLRLTRPEEDQLVIKRLAPVELALYVSQGYIARRGLPADDLSGHDAVHFAELRAFSRENEWLERELCGASVSVRSNSVSTVYASCVGGAGIALLPRIVADRDSRLVRVREAGPEPRWIWQAMHQDLAQTARMRAVSAWLAEIFTPPPAAAHPNGR
jgi:DNA-binding transcriptional LysR family regulator